MPTINRWQQLITTLYGNRMGFNPDNELVVDGEVVATQARDADGNIIGLFQTAATTAANFSTGDYGFAEFDVDISSITGTYQAPSAFWRHIANPSSTTYSCFGMIPTGTEALGTTPWSGTIRTPIQQIYSGISSTLLSMRMYTFNGGTYTVKIRNPRLQKVDVSALGLIQPGVNF